MALAIDSGLTLNPLGILLAVVFALLIGGLLLWMFRVPAPIAQAVGQGLDGLGLVAGGLEGADELKHRGSLQRSSCGGSAPAR